MDVKFLGGKVIVKIGTERVSVDGTSSANWDESDCGRLKQILITYDKDAINSIQMVYQLQDYAPVKLAPRHGGRGRKFYAIGLNGSNEHVTSVRGHFGVTKTTSYTVIRSLRFNTNLGSFGPFGCEEGTPFSFDFTSNSSFCGFHGWSNSMYLTAIGVYRDISNLRCFQYPTENCDPPLYEARKILPALPPP